MSKNLSYFKLPRNLTRIQHLLRQKRHYEFIGNVEEFDLCFRPPDFKENIYEACDFVSNTDCCTDAVNLINYLKFFVCTLKMDNSFVGATLVTILTMILLAFYFLCLYVVSRYFLLPNSIILSNYFNMKNYDFGVIVLGPLFTLPGVMTLIFSCSSSNRSDSLVYAHAYGCMFTSFVIGLCLLSFRKNFKLNPGIFVREMLFFGIGTYHIYFALDWEIQNQNKHPYERSKSHILTHAYVTLIIYSVYALNIILFSRARHIIPDIYKNPQDIPSSSETIDSDSYPEYYENPIERDIDPFDLFIECITPLEAFKGVPKFFKVLMLPFYSILALFIPVVHRQRRLNGWCKFIFCTSFLTFPLYFIKLNVGALNLITAIMLGIICYLLSFFLTHSQRIPANHDLVALWGLLLGFAIFNIIDGEVGVLLWQLLSYTQNWTDDTIVILAFPLSRVFVEGIFVIILLENGYPNMALGFVIGIVMFIAYSVIPVTVYSVCFDETRIFSLTASTTTAFCFMVIVQFITVFALSLNGFELRRSTSIFFALIQAIYSLFMILSNSEIIHPYGTMHSLTVFIDVLHSQWA